MFDGQAFGVQVVDAVKGYVAKALVDIKSQLGILAERIDDLELREPVNGKDGAPGLNGKDGAPGIAGENGLDADQAVIAKMVADAAAALPKAKDGKDGVSYAGALINRAGALVLTRSDGSTIELGVVQGRDGKDGRDGIDGADGSDGAPGADGKDGAPGRNGDPGLNGKDGLNLHETALADIIKSRIADFAKDLQQPDLAVPDDICELTAKACAVLAESPGINQRASGRVSRTIKTRRDENGYLVADIVERATA